MDSPSTSSFFQKKSFRTLLLCTAIFVVSFGVCQLIDTAMENYCTTQYDLLNPRRRCDKEEAQKPQEYDVLMSALQKKIDGWIANNDVSHVTVFFRDLDKGSIFSINGNEHFAPASLLKVPVMMALLHYAEGYPQILDEQIEIGDKLPEGANLTDPNQTLVPHQVYTIEEMLRRMIVYSDNSSKEVIRSRLETISPGIINQTFIDLGIDLQNPDGTQYITVKSYAAMFRSLFNASYLDRAMSEKALKLLTETDFPIGLEAGIPKDMKMAHKFGYLEVSENEEQLHDCGIVYYPDTAYLLCIMARGKDPNQIAETIAQISKVVYDEVKLRNP